jgi:hypothetical protein
MKRTASARKKSSASATSTDREGRSPSRLPKGARFVVCVNNDGYQASLERNKIYVALPDVEAESAGDIRVIDESGEDYLFSAKRFVAVELPQAVQTSVRRAS